jgi:hypothetical protein
MTTKITDLDDILNGPSSSYTVSTSPWITGSNATWTTSNAYTIASPNTAGAMVGANGKIQLQGENADIEINGKSIVKMLERIEERLNILSVNQDLEAEWEELRELGDQYRELEQQIKSKMETWAKLKAQDSDNR